MLAQLGAELGQAGEVVRQIGHADLHLRPAHADGAHEQGQAVLPRGKDMLDAGADPGACSIGLGLLLGKPRRGALRNWILSDRPRRSSASRLRLVR
jgi:hypothetical protein